MNRNPFVGPFRFSSYFYGEKALYSHTHIIQTPIPQQGMIDESEAYEDAAWEEYLSTGIDPTGGELGPDFDPETGRVYDGDASYEDEYE